MNFDEQHIVQFSGGICSFLAALRVVERVGKKGVVLLFANTLIEDEDLYRFSADASAYLGIEITEIADGRTPWQVMEENKMFAGPRVDMCSRELKRDLLDKWHIENCLEMTTTIYVGLDWTEPHRLPRLQALKSPWKVEAPMMEPPFLNKRQMIAAVEALGIRPPRLYGMGFPHNNCGGFCVKAGQAHFAHLLKVMPERFAFHEAKEQALREVVGDYAILRDRTGGTTKALTLRELRERIENGKTFDALEWGGCGCAVE